MPTYDFRCEEHGVMEMVCKIAERKGQHCPTCGEPVKQIMTTAPSLDTTAMAYADMPGAIMRQQDRMHKAHTNVSQSHRPIAKDDFGQRDYSDD